MQRGVLLVSSTAFATRTNVPISSSFKRRFDPVLQGLLGFTKTRFLVSDSVFRPSRTILKLSPVFFRQRYPMTSRAVLYSLRSLRFNRVLFNARRWRFLDSVVYYGGAVNGRRPFPFLNKLSPPPSQTYNTKQLSINRKSEYSNFHSSHSTVELETEFNLEISTEGLIPQNDENNIHANLPNLITALQEDVMKALKYLVNYIRRPLKKEVVELSLILCDDRHIHDLNLKHLSVDRPTDVLSFPLDGTEEDDGFPVMMLGDIVLSLETAEKQSKAMGHDLISECRILIVHALLHLLGYDHDQSDQQWTEMAEMERKMLKGLDWKGQGLIADIRRLMVLDTEEEETTPSMEVSDSAPKIRNTKDQRIRKGQNFIPDRAKLSSKKSQDLQQSPDLSKTSTSQDLQQSPNLCKTSASQDLQLVALDLDGTLLTSDQRISRPTKEAIEATIQRGIQVVVATGKARPGAIRACEKFGLSGPDSLISSNSAGIFLQGLVVHTTNGQAIEGPNLPLPVVQSIFEYCMKMEITCGAFTGDEICTLQTTPALIELHERYYEPFPEQLENLDEILTTRPVKKMIIMEQSKKLEKIGSEITQFLTPFNAKTVISVEGMLEIIPKGVNKWTALNTLVESLKIPVESCLTIGDGVNDYEMVKNAAIGVAMGNAVPSVKAVADFVVASNDEDGIAEALDRLILS